MRERQFATFQVGKDLLGVEILLVREIIRQVEFTPLEDVPAGVRGLLNLRGQIITVLDLAMLLGLPPARVGPGTRCIILKTREDVEDALREGVLEDRPGPDPVGLLVERIGDVVTTDERTIEAPPANAGGISGEFLQGVCKLDERLLLLLRVERVLERVAGRGVAAQATA